jgi:hypothetical protein
MEMRKIITFNPNRDLTPTLGTESKGTTKFAKPPFLEIIKPVQNIFGW